MREIDLLEQYLNASPEQRRNPAGIFDFTTPIVSKQNQAAAIAPTAEGQSMPIMKDSAKGVPTYLMKNEDYAKQAKIPNSISRTYTPTAEDNLTASLIKGLPQEVQFKAERQDVAPVQISQPPPEVIKPKVMKKPIPKVAPKVAPQIAAATIPVAPPVEAPIEQAPPIPEPEFQLPEATAPQTSLADKYSEDMNRQGLKSDIDTMALSALADKFSGPSDLRNKINDKILEFATSSKPFEPSRNYNADIDALNKESQALKNSSDGDMWTHLIYKLGAPLLGAMTGGAGALAAPKAQAAIDKESEMHWKAKAQMRAKLEDSISKRINAIKGLEANERAGFRDDKKDLIEKFKMLDEVAKNTDMTRKDNFDKIMDMYKSLSVQAQKFGFEAPKNEAEIEQNSINEQGRNQRDADKRDAEAWRAQQKAIEDAKALKARQDFTAAENEKRMKFQAEQNKNRDAALKSRAGIIASTRTTPDERQLARDQQTHKANVLSMKRDPIMKTLSTNAFNLNKAKNLLEDPSVVETPEKLQEVQQSIISAMGIKGAGGVDERKARNAVKGLNVKISEVISWLTTKPQKANAPEIKRNLENMIHNEEFSNKFLVDPYLDAKGSGFKSLYERRPELKADLMDLVDKTNKTFDIEVPQRNQPLSKPVKEMTKEEKIEYIKRGGK